MTRGIIERRIALLEQRKTAGDRRVHFIKAADLADSQRQIAELVAAGEVGPRDGFLSLTGWTDMPSFHDRVRKLEQRRRPRSPGLSSERRKHLTDRAVSGDQEALQELNQHRPRIIHASPEQRAGAVAAGLRANDF